LSGELDEVLTQLTLLPAGEISDIDQRDYLDIEYYSLTPPPPDLRKKIEDLLPPERYRLVRISRKYLQQSSSEVHASKIDLADFMTLLQDAQQSEHKVKTADNT
jgi:exonuclease SbcD